MRLLIVGVLLTGSCLLAQTSATGFGRVINPSGLPVAPGTTGFGRMIYPGTGGPPAVVRPGTNAAPARGGGRGRGAEAPPSVPHRRHSDGAVVAYPVYLGGSYYPYDAPAAPQGYGYDPSYDPNYGGQPSPVVIINQDFRPDVINPQVTDYSNAQLPQYIPPPPQPAQARVQQPRVSGADPNAALIFLIAMKDHTIYPAVAYWVEGDTLNYMTNQGVRNRISLELVDREFSTQLNKERNVDFGLPDPPPAPPAK